MTKKAVQLESDDRSLFSLDERVDPRHAGYAESSFAFLDRVAQPYWARIRDVVDSWFRDFPSGEASRDLRSRFRKDDPRQHYAAWWELYLFTFFTRCGFAVAIHPVLHDCDDRPDFLVCSGRGTFYVEAATTFSGLDEGRPHSPLEAEVMDAIETVRTESFTLSLTFEQLGTAMPRIREIARPIEEWLDTLNPDSLLETGECPTHLFPIRDWELELTAFPIERHHRGPVKHVIGGGPVMVGSVNDTEKLRDTLNRKRGKYGNLDAPLLLAVLMPSTFADLLAVEKALFGDTALRYYMGERGREHWVRLRNGFWTDKHGPRAQHVSGVISAFGLLPGSDIATKRVRLWPNPWADHPLAEELAMPKSVGSAEAQFEHQEDETAASPRELFGLDADWPGPDPPFID